MYRLDSNSGSGESAPCRGNAQGGAAELSGALPPRPLHGNDCSHQVHPVLELLIARYGGPWVRAAELPVLFASWDLAHRCTKAGWLKPILRGRRRTLYRLSDIAGCMNRIEAGECPPARQSR